MPEGDIWEEYHVSCERPGLMWRSQPRIPAIGGEPLTVATHLAKTFQISQRLLHQAALKNILVGADEDLEIK